MNITELKAFMESADGKSEEVVSYLQGLFPVTVAGIKTFVETAEGRAWLDSVKDKHLQKGLETWKTNNLADLIDAEVKKRFPEKDPKDIEVERLKNEISTMQTEKLREALTNKAMKAAGEKGLPLDLVAYFVGADEDATNANLKMLEDTWSAAVQSGLDARLKGDGYVPPKDGGNAPNLEDMSMSEYIKARQSKTGGNS